MSKDQTSMSEELFKLDGKPSTSQALPLALQHVVAMVVGCVAPAIIISGVAGLSASDSVILIQAALTMSAISTLFQVFPLLREKKTCNWGRITCYHGYQFCLFTYYAGNCW